MSVERLAFTTFHDELDDKSSDSHAHLESALGGDNHLLTDLCSFLYF